MPDQVRVFGIDPSLSSTGVACVVVDQLHENEFAWTERIVVSSRGCLRLDDIVKRLVVLMSSSGEYHIAARYTFTLAVIEGPIYHTPKLRNSAGGSEPGLRGYHERAGLWWGIAARLWRMGVPFAVAPPSSIKKYATGNGKAAKDLVLGRMVAALPAVGLESNDEADALAAALLGAHRLTGRAVFVPETDYRTVALDGVEWPTSPDALGWAGLMHADAFDRPRHSVAPLDGHDDAFRCSCGEVFESAAGFAVCPAADRLESVNP